MRRAVFMFAALVVYGASVGSGTAQQEAWCEANCKALCTIWDSAGAAKCFAQIPCANYVGKARATCHSRERTIHRLLSQQ